VRTRITSVDQDTTLFSGTIRSNLLLGDDTADDDTLFRALEHAHLLEFVRSLPNGLDTPVGENASSLSGGQRQRLSLARALLRHPDILILDEVTAGLDREAGSALIREAVARAKSVDQSLLIVTHRDEELATLENSVRLHNGKIVPYS
jgi:ABC-type multidrug transport system fused ATPase/permease subunit